LVIGSTCTDQHPQDDQLRTDRRSVYAAHMVELERLASAVQLRPAAPSNQPLTNLKIQELTPISSKTKIQTRPKFVSIVNRWGRMPAIRRLSEDLFDT